MKSIPSISSRVVGLLGALHLPRLHEKVILGHCDQLAPGYDVLGNGFDQMALDNLGLDKNAVKDYIEENTPTLCEFELWVALNGTKVTQANIAYHNAAIRGYNHSDETRKQILAAAGSPDNEFTPRDAVSLNEIEDKATFAALIAAEKAASATPTPPEPEPPAQAVETSTAEVAA